MNKRPFAVFDIDGTIFRSSLFLEMTYKAIENGILPMALDSEIKDVRNAWKKRKESDAYEKYIIEAVNSFNKHIVGVDSSELQKIAEETIENYHEHTYVFTRNLIKSLKNKGYFLIAITGSPSEVAHEFTKRYSFDYVKSTDMQTVNGKYIGKSTPADNDKRGELEKIVKKYNLTITGSVAVGDTKNDAEMLSFVENPIAFNPDKKLFQKAKENNWKVVIERKNMIYEMESKNGEYSLSDTISF